MNMDLMEYQSFCFLMIIKMAFINNYLLSTYKLYKWTNKQSQKDNSHYSFCRNGSYSLRDYIYVYIYTYTHILTILLFTVFNG